MGLSTVQSVAENSFMIPSPEADVSDAPTRLARNRGAGGLEEALLLFASFTLLLFGRLKSATTNADEIGHSQVD